MKAEASAEAVRDRLATADLLHYAGHGTYSGFGGWESSLLLAEETRLTLGDLLALKRVPTWVVLSGCDTGRSSAETPVEGLGLAHAFLLAGSQAVVASTGPAADRTVPAFFAELYRQWDREPDLALALQRAQLSWRGAESRRTGRASACSSPERPSRPRLRNHRFRRRRTFRRRDSRLSGRASNIKGDENHEKTISPLGRCRRSG